MTKESREWKLLDYWRICVEGWTYEVLNSRRKWASVVMEIWHVVWKARPASIRNDFCLWGGEREANPPQNARGNVVRTAMPMGKDVVIMAPAGRTKALLFR